MDRLNNGKFEINDVLIFFIKDGQTILGKLVRQPEPIYHYWHVTMPGDTSLMAIPEEAIKLIICPSEDYLNSFAENALKNMEALDKKEEV